MNKFDLKVARLNGRVTTVFEMIAAIVFVQHLASHPEQDPCRRIDIGDVIGALMTSLKDAPSSMNKASLKTGRANQCLGFESWLQHF